MARASTARATRHIAPASSPPPSTASAETLAARAALMVAESGRALVSEARAQRPQETLRKYDRIQAEWRAWCDKKGFDEGTRCVSALLAFIFLTTKG